MPMPTVTTNTMPTVTTNTMPALLVVDDEPELRGLLAEYFDRHGFAVRTAPDAAQARDLAREHATNLMAD